MTCVIYGGEKNQAGYGRCRVNGRHIVVTRFIWEQIFGSIPVGLYVLHKCDTPSCVNIDHLFLGTYKDNAQDKVRKGRGNNACGEKQGLSVLTEEQVLEIRASNLSQRKLAKIYNIDQTTVSQIKRRATWRHI